MEAKPKDLAVRALRVPDDEARWKIIVALQDRGDREVLDLARSILESDRPEARRLGADILAQGRARVKTFHEEAVTALLQRLTEGEEDERALEAVCAALGHRHDPRAVGPLTALRTHTSVDVRFTIATALAGFDDDRAITALIALTADTDADVRDWATFGLGSQTDADSPRIRAALLERLADDDADTQGEALVGLARRHDERVVAPLLAALEAGAHGSLVLEAAIESADPRLLAPLTVLRGEPSVDATLLEEAIAACSLMRGDG